MKKNFAPAAILAVGMIAFSSIGCKKDNSGSNPPVYTVPDTYNFSDADSIKAKTILSMFAEIEIAINKGNTSGNTVSAAQLKGMYANQGSFFTDTTFNGVTLNLNASGIQLQSSTFTAAQAVMLTVMDSIGIASATGLPASNGVAGVSTRKTLLSAHGIYWRQFFTKTMMGVLLGHQITDILLGDSLNSAVPNAAKIHAWDQAFYLWCVPANFPANRTGVKYWGSYTSQIDSGITKPVTILTGINANTTLLNAFLKGRAALSAGDNATALQQAAIIIPIFETMEAAAALHELNEAKGNLPNGAAAVCGNLSESLGFWTALKFNTHKKISDADYQSVLSLYGDNFYNITPAGIDAILDKISTIYGWDAIKSNL
ncbi:MAG: DUF4856 domain-containing protein [Bacteroidetes bacterium]|nr:DUF4856 domain-containing protein [Bacteroidota bacterium]